MFGMFLMLVGVVYYVTNGSGDNSPGTLIWAINQANSNPGFDTIYFNIPTSDPSHTCVAGNCWWRITLTMNPPAITDSVLIDGFSQTSNRGNTNQCNPAFRAFPDSTGWTSVQNSIPRVAGVRRVKVPFYPCPEIEINLNDRSSTSGLISVSSRNVIIRGIALYNGGGGSGNQVIRIRPGSYNVVLENVIVGLRADGSIPALGDSTSSDGIFADSATSGIIRKVYVGLLGTHCVKFGNTAGGPTGGWIVDSSEIFGCAWNSNVADNVNIYTRRITFMHNLIHSSDGNSSASNPRVFGAGIEVRYDGDTATINENTIYNNATKGIFVDGTSQYVMISGNLIFGNGWRLPGPGVGVGKRDGNSKYVLITKNSFANNGGLAIDLDSSNITTSAGDGITCNDNLRQGGNPNELIDYPYIDSARVVISSRDTLLYIWGRAYTGADSVEIYLVSTPDVQNCPLEANGHGEGGLFLGSLRVVLDNFSGIINLNGLGINWFSPQMITAISKDNSGNTSEFSHNYPLPTPLYGDNELIVQEYNLNSEDYVEIYSADGKLIFKGKFGDFKPSKGVYFIKGKRVFKKILR